MNLTKKKKKKKQKKKKKTNKYTKQCFHRNYSEINHY